MNTNALILFTRIPVAGKTKTRLQPFLTGEECCLLQKAFLQDLGKALQESEICCDIMVCYAPEGDLNELKGLLPGISIFFPQRGGDLGEKMHNAISDVLAKGYGRCLLLGSDIPLMKSSDINEAVSHLDCSDVVVCPTEDGGYYMIGMKEPNEELFRLNEYGVSTVLEKTLSAAEKAGKSCTIGAKALDVDEPNDLLRLKEMLEQEAPETCPETRKILQDFLNS